MARRLDLPLASDPASRFLPPIIAVTVFLAALALAVALALAGAADRWRTSLDGTITIEIPAPNDPEVMGHEKEIIEDAMAVLDDTPGIALARRLSRAEIAELLRPWLGDGAMIDDLPLPTLIDVTLERGGTLDTAKLREQLAAVAEGVQVDDHAVWFGRLVRAAETTRFLALLTFALVLAAAAVIVIFVTRTGLAVHREVIDLMHIMGATDAYIAGQFQSHVAGLAFRGGLIGLVLAAIALGALVAATHDAAPSVLPALRLDGRDWLYLLALPFAAALIARFAARWTVIRALARLP